MCGHFDDLTEFDLTERQDDDEEEREPGNE